ncbi:YceI family protein [Hellea balneolensis]|uniref:YceI family protein n=1 Tax=Hellea balneolensis TaxID=287478 RepID=UPI000429AD83|nr:YceI family protein [Hellea balneolensis]
MRYFALPITATFLTVSACSQAAEPTSSSQPTISSPALDMKPIGNWIVVKADSHIKFTATQQGKGFTGEFENYDVLINFNEDAIDAASVVAEIDVSSISTGDEERDSTLIGTDWFNVKSIPKAVFRSDDFIKTGDKRYEARGTLSMKDTSQPLTLPFTLDITGSKAEMDAELTLDRTLWNVGAGSWATDEWVSTKVVVDIKISAENPN